MTRFSKVFQLLTVVLVVAIVNVYVMGAPKASTDPKKADAAATTVATTDLASAENVANAKVTPVAVASEKLKLAPGSKVDFNRIFSRTEIASRATASHNFLNAKTAASDLFKAPPRVGAAPADSDNDTGGGGSRGTWIALGVIAAVVTVAVIALRHDRSSGMGSAAPH